MIAAWLALAGCADGGGLGGSGRDLTGLYAMAGGEAWTYREWSDADPDPEALLLARHEGGGFVSLRRGARWSDAAEVGHLEWDEAEGLILRSWSLDGASGEDPFQVVDPDAEPGELVISAGGRCTQGTYEPVETFYGTFSDTLVSACEGSDLASRFAFARGFGLVQLSGGGRVLDLVAPY